MMSGTSLPFKRGIKGDFLNKIYERRGSIEMKKILEFIKDEEGAAVAEYGLLAVLIAVACIIALTAVGVGVFDLFTYSANEFPK
jgi:Flp pilus assembly pilin Flp